MDALGGGGGGTIPETGGKHLITLSAHNFFIIVR